MLALNQTYDYDRNEKQHLAWHIPVAKNNQKQQSFGGSKEPHIRLITHEFFIIYNMDVTYCNMMLHYISKLTNC